MEQEYYIMFEGQRIPVTVTRPGEPMGPPMNEDPESRVWELRMGDAVPELPLPERIRYLTLRGPVTPELIQRAGEVLTRQPGLSLQVTTREADFGYIADLPPLTGLRVLLSLDIKSVDAIAVHAGSLRFLELETGLPPLDLSALAALENLEQLYLRKANRTLKGAETALAGMTRLRHLTLHSVTLTDTGVLSKLSSLQSLAFKLGGNRDLSALPALRRLRFLEIWGTKMLEDLTPLAVCDQLSAFYLSQLPRAALPDMSGASNLEAAAVLQMPNLGGLAHIAAAPRLRYLRVVDCGLTAADVEGLRGHPTMEGAWLPLPGQPLLREADPILGLPRGVVGGRLIPQVAGVMALPINYGNELLP